MIPPFQEDGYLPKGIHETTWQEIYERLSFSPHRIKLLEGLWDVIQDLREVGCQEIYIDGSFVKYILEPNDIDICYSETNVNFKKMKEEFPELSNITWPRLEQKERYQCEILPSKGLLIDEDDKPYYWLEYFQKTKKSDQEKGILNLKIEDIR